MKLRYYQDTDSLYIDLSSKTSTDSYEVSPGVVVDLDENKKIVGIDIDNASNVIDLNKLSTEHLPIKELSQVM